jgi:hypothetical protein
MVARCGRPELSRVEGVHVERGLESEPSREILCTVEWG